MARALPLQDGHQGVQPGEIMSGISPSGLLSRDINPHRGERWDQEHWLRTERLFLRPVRNADVDDYAMLLADPQVMHFVGLDQGHLLSREESIGIVWSAIETWQKHGFGRWSVFDRSGAFVGFCGFRAEECKPDFICLIHARYWGVGVAAEAADAVIEYGFASLGFSEIKSYCRPGNVRARRLLEKLGAQFVGVIDFHGVDGAEYRLFPTYAV
jgi:RimJ/RimL family protein N-acetyltransferase